MTSWCSTCGKETPDGVTECDACRRWWEENPPPADFHKSTD